MLKFSRKAEGIFEYALIISTISLALATMNFYLKRGIQARIRDITSSVMASPEQVTDLFTEDSYRGLYNSSFTTTQSATSNLNTQGNITTVNLSENIQQRGSETQAETTNYWNDPNKTIPITRGMPRRPTDNREQAEQEAERRMEEERIR